MTSLHRVEVRTRPGLADPRSQAVLAKAAGLGLELAAAQATKVYLLEGELDDDTLAGVATALLADPVTEEAVLGAADPTGTLIEVHPLPGVMDPAALSVQAAVRELTGLDVAVSTGVRYDLDGVDAETAAAFVSQALANPVVHQIVAEPYLPESLPQGHEYAPEIRTIPLRGLSDEELTALSREAHLFLTPEELRAVATYYEQLDRDPTDIELETIAQTWSEHCVHKTLKSTVIYREASAEGGDNDNAPPPEPKSRRVNISFEFTPTGSKADAAGRPGMRLPDPVTDSSPGPVPGALSWKRRPGHQIGEAGEIVIDNLLKSTVAAATHELIKDGIDWTLSVFKDNSGVIEFDETFGVCVKVETHNHPSAIEPYGGAATGAGGCIRDVLGTGLGARPIASTDIFCVADPRTEALPPGCLPPRRILTDVVAGVRDYGNRMGIPTLNGAVYFDDRYIGNPLVFCGCVGLIPRTCVKGAANAGDIIVALGGRTGRDGIHGATFSSAEMEATHADEFSHAVQIGNAIEEKRVTEAVLRARDAGPLFSAITDCGAGGFSSAVGEMGKDLGAEVHLDRAPLKYAGLTYTEIWISEAQERMVLAVPPDNFDALRAICDEEGVEMAELGVFGVDDKLLRLFYAGEQVGELSMDFLHDGIPMPTREALWVKPVAAEPAGPQPPESTEDCLTALLAHPNIASKHWIIRQYDHEVQGNTLIKPLTGTAGRGPSDASVLEPVPGKGKGLAIACGLQVGVGDASLGGDPYQMALAGIDECVRNLVCVGADPARIAILDNFCWPSCDRPENMGALVRACAGCYDGAKAYRAPFVSGKDSLNNQLRYTDPDSGEPAVIEIPHTLLISGIAHVRSVARCVTMDAKKPDNILVLIGANSPAMGGSHFQRLWPGAQILSDEDAAAIPTIDLKLGPAAARAVAQMIADGFIRAAHDCSDGGLLVAVAEMLIATTAGGASPSAASAKPGASALNALLATKPAPAAPALGAELTLTDSLLEPAQLAFGEAGSRYILEMAPDDLTRCRTVLRDYGGVNCTPIGKVTPGGRLKWSHADLDVSVDVLAQAWLSTLDW